MVSLESRWLLMGLMTSPIVSHKDHLWKVASWRRSSKTFLGIGQESFLSNEVRIYFLQWNAIFISRNNHSISTGMRKKRKIQFPVLFTWVVIGHVVVSLDEISNMRAWTVIIIINCTSQSESWHRGTPFAKLWIRWVFETQSKGLARYQSHLVKE